MTGERLCDVPSVGPLVCSFMGLDYVELVMDIEKRSKTCIDDEAASRIRTVADLVGTVLERAPGAPSMNSSDHAAARALYEAAVMLEVRRMVAAQIGERVEKVRPESRLVEDLKMG